MVFMNTQLFDVFTTISLFSYKAKTQAVSEVFQVKRIYARFTYYVVVMATYVDYPFLSSKKKPRIAS